MLVKIGNAYIDPDEVAAIEPWEDESCFCESPYAAFHLKTGAIIVIEKISQEDLNNFILSAALADL